MFWEKSLDCPNRRGLTLFPYRPHICNVLFITNKYFREKWLIMDVGFSVLVPFINPFTFGDFAEKRVLKLVEWLSGHCRAIKS